MTTTQTDIRQKISTRQAVISIIGLGYVGLPLATVFAEAGFRVHGIDVDSEKVGLINSGVSYIQDVPDETVAKLTSGASEGELSATTDYDVLSEADVVIVCVPTPLSKTKDPDVTYIVSAAEDISRRLHRGMLVILESTTYPGSTEELILPHLLEHSPGPLEVGSDFYLAFSPERVDPGQTTWNISNTPKVIGGVTPSCTDVASTLYKTVVRQVVEVSSPKTAETVKLLENTFRAANIALVNEVAIMCDKLDIDVWEVISAASTKPFGYMPFYPGPGLGGHCIPIDPQYLAWKMKTLNYTARFIQLAEEVNFSMPEYVVGKVSDALNDDSKALRGSRVLILGAAYKADVGDIRESPALDLIHLLQEKGAAVDYHDPLVPNLDEDGLVLQSVDTDGQPSLSDALSAADCTVIVTAHSSYDWESIVLNSQKVVDTRNATGAIGQISDNVVKL